MPLQAQTTPSVRMASNTSEFDRSISLDESSEIDNISESHSHGETWMHPQPASDTEIRRLKAESTYRLQRRWDEIISKYSGIDDEKESDEIDLHTGRIIVDNGHLSSFTGDQQMDGPGTIPNLWAPEDDLERESRKNKHAEKLKKRLSSTSHFFNEHISGLDSGSDSSEDNLSLLNPSPTKKHRAGTSKTSAEVVLSGTNDLPTCLQSSRPLSLGHTLATPKSSPLKQKLPVIHSSPHGTSHGNASNDDILSSPTRPSPKNAGFKSHIHRPSNEVRHHENIQFNVRSHIVQDDEGDDSETDDDDVYNESFSMLELCGHSSISLFACAFHGCRFTSGSKVSYRAHLLERHSPELQRIGYPIISGKKHEYPIPGDTIPRLNLHFPLRIELPAGRPYTCGAKLANGTCRKIFIERNHLFKHRQSHPRVCSAKRQVFPCPLLGCDFMTDTSYDEFYEHVQAHNKDSLLLKGDKIKENSNELLIKSPYKNLSELIISDSEADEEVSDSQAEQNATSTPTRGSDKCNHLNAPQPKLLPISLEFKRSPTSTKLSVVPKFEILDTPDEQETDPEEETRDVGYTSIDELFKNDRES